MLRLGQIVNNFIDCPWHLFRNNTNLKILPCSTKHWQSAKSFLVSHIFSHHLLSLGRKNGSSCVKLHGMANDDWRLIRRRRIDVASLDFLIWQYSLFDVGRSMFDVRCSTFFSFFLDQIGYSRPVAMLVCDSSHHTLAIVFIGRPEHSNPRIYPYRGVNIHSVSGH